MVTLPPTHRGGDTHSRTRSAPGRCRPPRSHDEQQPPLPSAVSHPAPPIPCAYTSSGVRSCSPSGARQAGVPPPCSDAKMTPQRSCIVVPRVEVCASIAFHAASESRPSQAPCHGVPSCALMASSPRRAGLTRADVPTHQRRPISDPGARKSGAVSPCAGIAHLTGCRATVYSCGDVFLSWPARASRRGVPSSRAFTAADPFTRGSKASPGCADGTA